MSRRSSTEPAAMHHAFLFVGRRSPRRRAVLLSDWERVATWLLQYGSHIPKWGRMQPGIPLSNEKVRVKLVL